MAFFDRDGRRIYYASFGTGKPIVFLHGITNSGRAWANQIGSFTRAGYQVILPDLAGHGSSSPIVNTMAPNALAQDVLALMDFLQIDKADCCGLSLGGTVAVEAGAIQPDRFNKLVIANSFVRTDGEKLQQLTEQWKILFQQPDGPAKRLEDMWPVLVSETYRNSDEGLMTFQTWHAQAAMADGESYCHIVDGMSQYNATKVLPSLKHPVLIISSTNDKISPVANSVELAQLLPNNQHITIDESEHITNVDNADRFNAVVLSFLSR